MPVNPYFHDNKGYGAASERTLAEDLIIEMIQLSGHVCYYIPRTLFAEDKFYSEVPSEKFEEYYPIEMYINNVTDFGGRGDYLSTFGMNVEDTVEFVMSRKRFFEESGVKNPSEGDLVYFPLSKHLFEIDFVEDEPGNAGSINQFYSISRLYTFLLKCTLFTFSYEDFDTGITAIDEQFDADDYVPKEYDHTVINDEAEDNLDFTEQNPFGDTVE